MRLPYLLRAHENRTDQQLPYLGLKPGYGTLSDQVGYGLSRSDGPPVNLVTAPHAETRRRDGTARKTGAALLVARTWPGDSPNASECKSAYAHHHPPVPPAKVTAPPRRAGMYNSTPYLHVARMYMPFMTLRCYFRFPLQHVLLRLPTELEAGNPRFPILWQHRVLSPRI